MRKMLTLFDTVGGNYICTEGAVEIPKTLVMEAMRFRESGARSSDSGRYVRLPETSYEKTLPSRASRKPAAWSVPASMRLAK
jgi:hypothetical protein